jgi:hypothetical protein
VFQGRRRGWRFGCGGRSSVLRRASRPPAGARTSWRLPPEGPQDDPDQGEHKGDEDDQRHRLPGQGAPAGKFILADGADHGILANVRGAVGAFFHGVGFLSAGGCIRAPLPWAHLEEFPVGPSHRTEQDPCAIAVQADARLHSQRRTVTLVDAVCPWAVRLTKCTRSESLIPRSPYHPTRLHTVHCCRDPGLPHVPRPISRSTIRKACFTPQYRHLYPCLQRRTVRGDQGDEVLILLMGLRSWRLETRRRSH